MAREMKDSGIEWIGKIPVEWNVRPIKNSFSIVSGSTPNSDKAEYWDGDIAWITPADFKTIDKYTSGGSRYITKEGYNSCSTSIIPKGSIIFSKRAPIGSVVINTIDLCTNQGCLSCIKNDKTDSVFFYYIMSVYDDVFNQFGSGTTFKEISATTFSDFTLPLPPLEEQKLISSFLDSKCSKIDKAIEYTKISIEEYKKLKQSIITEAVTKGLNPNVEFKDSGIKWIGEIPSHWNASSLKRVLSIIKDGTHGTFQRTSQGRLLLSAKNVFEDGLHFFEHDSRVSEEDYNSIVANGFPQKDDVLMCCVGTIGRTMVYQELEPIAFQRSVSFLRCNNLMLPEYLNFFLNNSEIQKEEILMARGTAQVGLYMGDVLNLHIAIPPIEEQKDIIKYLKTRIGEINPIIKSKEKLIEELTAYRKSLIYEYVTGKKEVPAI